MSSNLTLSAIFLKVRNMTPILGIDASLYQGSRGMSHRRFKALNHRGVRFGIFRASIGNGRDSSCATNLRRAKALGWEAWTYHFLTPGDAASQAETYAAVCGNGLCVLDVEQSGVNFKDVKAFVARFRELKPNRPLACYTSEGAWHSLTNNADGNELFDVLWQARWTQLGTNEVSDLPPAPPRAGFGGWRTTPLWQYGAFRSQQFAIIDGDAFYGTREQLTQLGSDLRPPITERPNYRLGYNAAVVEALAMVPSLVIPDGPPGPAYPRGVEDAKVDITDAIGAQRLT